MAIIISCVQFINVEINFDIQDFLVDLRQVSYVSKQYRDIYELLHSNYIFSDINWLGTATTYVAVTNQQKKIIERFSTGPTCEKVVITCLSARPYLTACFQCRLVYQSISLGFAKRATALAWLTVFPVEVLDTYPSSGRIGVVFRT